MKRKAAGVGPVRDQARERPLASGKVRHVPAAPLCARLWHKEPSLSTQNFIQQKPQRIRAHRDLQIVDPHTALQAGKPSEWAATCRMPVSNTIRCRKGANI